MLVRFVAGAVFVHLFAYFASLKVVVVNMKPDVPECFYFLVGNIDEAVIVKAKTPEFVNDLFLWPVNEHEPGVRKFLNDVIEQEDIQAV